MYISPTLSLSFSSGVTNGNGFQQMARMMDSLILNEFPPYTFTKITTSHRPTRTNNGIATKLLAKSTASISPGGGIASVIRPTVQKPKVPLQGKLKKKNRLSYFVVNFVSRPRLGASFNRDIFDVFFGSFYY